MLIPTAEVQLVNLSANTLITESSLPHAYCAYSLCFRKEAGSYGKDTKGMFRMHQFEKVELVRIEKPENSYNALEQITTHAENILKKLELPYRVVELCTGDLDLLLQRHMILKYGCQVKITTEKSPHALIQKIPDAELNAVLKMTKSKQYTHMHLTVLA